MSKHTTRPVYVTGFHSHTCDVVAYPVGNWNSHVKRRVDSRLRTPGRMARFLKRHGCYPFESQDLVIPPNSAASRYQAKHRGDSHWPEPDTRDNSLG